MERRTSRFRAVINYFKKNNSYIWYGLVVGLFITFVFTLRIGLQPMFPEPLPQETTIHKTQQEEIVNSGEVNENKHPSEASKQIRGSLESIKESNIVTILLVGVDNRPGEDFISNTDTLIVANINKQQNQIALLSIPRDTQVHIEKHGTNKINNAARIGGSYQETIRVLEELLDQEIDGYIISDFSGFKRMIDAVGGITIQVEKDMVFNTGDQIDGFINLKKGIQRLNGTQALQYARFRNDALADISRTVRQQKVLKAIATEVLQLRNVPKIPYLIPEVYQSVYTDLPLFELISLAHKLIKLDQFNIVSQTLPGKFIIENDVSYWKVDARESKLVAENLFKQGITTSTFSDFGDNSESHVSSNIPITIEQKLDRIETMDNNEIRTEIIYVKEDKNANLTDTDQGSRGVTFEVLEP